MFLSLPPPQTLLAIQLNLDHDLLTHHLHGEGAQHIFSFYFCDLTFAYFFQGVMALYLYACTYVLSLVYCSHYK